MSAANGLSTTTFGYDHNDQRVWMNTASASTTYPSKYFQRAAQTIGATTTATTTAYIFLPDGSLIATVVGNGTATSTYYMHPDHLGSTNVVTDADGALVQTLDYYPYGGKRIDEGDDASEREFIGEHFDGNSELSYLNARYYDGARGQFLSQDPVHVALGNRTEVGRLTKQEQRRLLANPHAMNSYGYARGNPITMKDPEGLWGVFFTGSLGVDAGLGEGFAGSVQRGYGFTTANDSLSGPTEFGKFTSGGFLVGGPFQSTTIEGPGSVTW